LSGVKYAGISCCVEVTCAANEFRCASGTQCVDPYAQCNGVADCDDASDETVELCGKNLVAYPGVDVGSNRHYSTNRSSVCHESLSEIKCKKTFRRQAPRGTSVLPKTTWLAGRGSRESRRTLSAFHDSNFGSSDLAVPERWTRVKSPVYATVVAYLLHISLDYLFRSVINGRSSV